MSGQLVKSRLKEIDSHVEYQGVEVKNFDDVLKQCTTQVKEDVSRLNEKIKRRLEWSDVQLMRSILILVETQSWQLHSDEEDAVSEVSQAAEYVVAMFRVPLEAKGFSAEVIVDEIENVVSYARYLPIGTDNYRKIWYKLFTSPDSGKWTNVLILSELVLSLPKSTCRVEQLFSKLKVIKTKRRSSLSNSTLDDLLEINVEGPPLSSFDASSAVWLWWTDSRRRVNQQARKEYRPRHSREPSEESATDSSTLPSALSWDEWFDSD